MIWYFQYNTSVMWYWENDPQKARMGSWRNFEQLDGESSWSEYRCFSDSCAEKLTRSVPSNSKSNCSKRITWSNTINRAESNDVRKCRSKLQILYRFVMSPSTIIPKGLPNPIPVPIPIPIQSSDVKANPNSNSTNLNERDPISVPISDPITFSMNQLTKINKV